MRGRCGAEQPATNEVPERGRIVVAVDGKTLRGTIPRGPTRGGHRVAADRPESGVVLAHVAVDRKEHERMAVPKRLRHRDLPGMVVVGDAMQAPRARAIPVVEAGGDDGWFVQANQPSLLADLALLVARPHLAQGWSGPSTDCRTATPVEPGHGRRAERTITVSRMRRAYVDWPARDQVCRRARIVTAGGKCMGAVRYGSTSVPPQHAAAARLLAIARTAWGIAHGLPARRDVTVRDDAGQVRRGQAPHVLAAWHHVVIGSVPRAGHAHRAAAPRAFPERFDRLLARRRAM